MEGNTRTTAVFMECYLNNMGFPVENEMFKSYSLYFRNALVVANYASFMEGIIPNTGPLIKFYENLLLNGEHQLRNKELFVMECFSDREQEELKRVLSKQNPFGENFETPVYAPEWKAERDISDDFDMEL